jgi:hypothetical protein
MLYMTLLTMVWERGTLSKRGAHNTQVNTPIMNTAGCNYDVENSVQQEHFNIAKSSPFSF